MQQLHELVMYMCRSAGMPKVGGFFLVNFKIRGEALHDEVLEPL